MSNGHSGPPNPPEKVEVTCIEKTETSVRFTGEGISIELQGNTQYFEVDQAYEVVFKPKSADNLSAG